MYREIKQLAQETHLELRSWKFDGLGWAGEGRYGVSEVGVNVIDMNQWRCIKAFGSKRDVCLENLGKFLQSWLLFWSLYFAIDFTVRKAQILISSRTLHSSTNQIDVTITQLGHCSTSASQNAAQYFLFPPPLLSSFPANIRCHPFVWLCTYFFSMIMK